MNGQSFAWRRSALAGGGSFAGCGAEPRSHSVPGVLYAGLAPPACRPREPLGLGEVSSPLSRGYLCRYPNGATQ